MSDVRQMHYDKLLLAVWEWCVWVWEETETVTETQEVSQAE